MGAIIFDVDGTLWDSTDTVARSWNLAIEETTSLDIRVTADQLKGLFGRPISQIAELLFPMLAKEERDELQKNLYTYEHNAIGKENCSFYEGVLETIPVLAKKHKLFIVSNCQSGYIEAFLKIAGLEEYIMDSACPGDTGLSKGENIKLIMERNHLDTAIYVGDIQGDADACKVAGIPVIYASYGFGDMKEPDYTISRFSDLLTFDFDSALLY